ncbi:Gmad2 immunoglobulin-like domain-containing protein [Paenibacillus sp. GYB003]|uniref:Gmad2 immunoglobulin-like domain-containing protein n=1 Tax=Paenibacillus sp. GYB003 TaxID=2994392 RepID=UPI002F96257E
MRIQKRFLSLALLGIAVIAASCGQKSGPADSGANPPPEPKTQAVKAVDNGTIISKEGNRWLITAYIEKNGTPYIDAYWFTVTDRTALQTSGGQTVTPDKAAIGAQVEAWHTGTVAESYPMQTAAAKIVVRDDARKAPEGMIGQAEAVRLALQSQTGSTMAQAVKNVSLHADNGYWNVELVRHEAVGQPATVRIDARSGRTIPIPVAENDAFRLFSPRPGTEASSPIVVEGEARVFEAAFSWTLEDGHNVLAEGHAKAEEGAPAWGRFRFEIGYGKASQPNMTLLLFVHSAKDGKVEHQLAVPLKVPKDRIDYTIK